MSLLQQRFTKMEKDNDIIKLISSTLSATDTKQQPDMPAATPASPCSSKEYQASSAPVSVTGKFSNMEDEYIIDPKVLGTGHHGSVRACVNRSTGKRFAVKTIHKTESTVKSSRLAREIKLLQEMQHPSIIRLIDVYEDAKCLHIITDLCTGGELIYKIAKRASRRESGMPCFQEEEAARLLHQMLTAVSYMHKRGIVHRNLKPENIIFADTSDDSPLKIIDFGLSRKHTRRETLMRSTVGTPYYIAPEVLLKKYDLSCDLWSVGVIAYILLCGYPPFHGSTPNKVHESVLRGRCRFPSKDWSRVSREAKSFICRLLLKDPTKRMTAEQALNHPWMTKHIEMSDKVVQEKSSLEVVFKGLSIREFKPLRVPPMVPLLLLMLQMLMLLLLLMLIPMLLMQLLSQEIMKDGRSTTWHGSSMNCNPQRATASADKYKMNLCHTRHTTCSIGNSHTRGCCCYIFLSESRGK